VAGKETVTQGAASCYSIAGATAALCFAAPTSQQPSASAGLLVTSARACFPASQAGPAVLQMLKQGCGLTSALCLAT